MPAAAPYRSAATLLVAIAVAACGHEAHRRTGPISDDARVAGGSAGSLGARPPVPLDSASPAPSGAPIGTALRVAATGTTLTVSVTRVIDPLTGSGAVLPPGDRAVGVLASVADDGPGGYDSAATADLSLLAGDGSAMPVLATTGPCATPRIDFEREIEPGETRTGCVVFTVPNSSALIAVRFAPAGAQAGEAVWSPAR